jgi:RNA polymerase sigma factor (sigma-70 family)
VGEERIPPREAEELAACFGAYARDLFGYACVLVREDGERAEDLVQAVFEAASRHWHRLSRLVEEQRHSWLRATLANIAIAWIRGEYGEHDEHGEHVEAAFRAWLPAAEASRRTEQADQAEQAFSPITLERCWQAIQSMPEPQHTVALLHWLQDMKPGEIAAALGMAEKTVSAHVHRARRKLIAQLGPENPYTSDDPDGAS